jgi:sugar lactone lactonase YvrE
MSATPDICAARFGDTLDGLAEGPIWSSATGEIIWFDVVNRVLHRHRLDGKGQDQSLPRLPGALALRAGGGWLMAWRNGLSLCDRPGGDWRDVELPIDFGRERINDGCVDPAGRFWFGTFCPKVTPGAGSLYRLDPDLSLHRIDTGVTMSNGIAWSPDGTTLYFADSRPGQIYRYAFDTATGAVGPREIFIDHAAAGGGRPDGICVDAEGCVWVAEVGAGRVARYDPRGRLVQAVGVPALKPTSLAFVGVDLGTLFITSMRLGLTDEEVAAFPLSGAVFTTQPGVHGLPERFFGG